jgi:hypothetical protein
MPAHPSDESFWYLIKSISQILGLRLVLQEFLKHGASLDPSVGYMKPDDARTEILSLEVRLLEV